MAETQASEEQPQVKRHLTAMHRHRCSRPVAMALADGLITKNTTVFDYGCGLAGDVKYLTARGIKAHGWDPHYKPRAKRREADVVNLGYVLNIIEDPSERVQALQEAFSLAKKLLIVAVRVDRAPAGFQEYGDGCLTGKHTFQKIYTQSEFREFLESTLDETVEVTSLGVAYVFRDKDAEARYLADRAFTRRLEYRTDLIEEFSKHPVAKRFVKQANKLGRIPASDEFKDYDSLVETFGSPQRIERLTLGQIKPEAFELSREQRRQDILTFLAMLRLQGIKPPPVGKLNSSVRRDIKAIWPRYKAALNEAHAFLFSLGKPDTVKEACRASPVGKLLPEDLYVHQSAEDELPALLRVMIFASRRIIGQLTYDVLKIRTDGRAASFLTYDRFDEDPHPALVRSVRVYLPKASYRIREYSLSGNPPILHRKDALVTDTYPHYATFRSLTEREEELGLLEAADIGRREEWESLLRSKNVSLDGHSVVMPTGEP